MPKILALVANQSHARLYGADSLHDIPLEIEDFSNAIARYQEQDLVSDSPGKSMTPRGQYPHPMGKEQETRHHNLEVFAKNIVAELERMLQNNTGTQLFLIAPPKFLGILRNKLVPSLQKHIAGEIAKDVTDIPAADVSRYLKEFRVALT